MSPRPLNVLWLTDHCCYDGSLHAGGKLFYNMAPVFDRERVRIHPYLLRSSEVVRELFAAAPLPIRVLDKAKYDPTSVLTVWRLCRQHRIDVMHLFTYASSTFGRLVGAVTGIPTVIQDFDTNHYFPYPLYLKVFDRLLADTTGHAFAASPLTLRYMNEVRRVPRERLELMTHAVPAAKFRASDVEARARQRAELGFASDEIVFVCPTKLGPDRGNEALFRAFALVVAARPRARLVLVYKPTHFHVVPDEYRHLEGVGDPNRMRKSLDELAAELGITDRVAFVESLDRPDPYLLAADVVVVPFENERFSSAHLLDAFAYGLPAVATRLGEQGELVEPEVSGILVAPGDDQAMGRAMLRLADDPAERRRMGLGAEAAARARSIEAWAARLTDLYTRLAQGRAVEPARSA